MTTDNGTNTTAADGTFCQDLPGLLPGLAAFQSLVLFSSFVGNLVVFLVFCKKPNLLTPSNRLILNLALTNFAMAVVVMPAVLVSFITDRWLFGDAWCQIVGLMTSVLFTACIFTLVLISLDRYCAIVTPLHYGARVTQTRTHVALGVVWLLSVLISSPPLFGWSRFTYQAEKHTCTVNWKTSDSGEKVYTLILTIVCFCAPFVLMLWVYVTICHAANANHKRARRRSSLSNDLLESHRNLNNGQATTNGRNGTTKRPSLMSAASSIGQVFRNKEEWKAAKTSLVIVFAFSVCWIPYFAIIALNSLLRNPERIPWCLESLSVVMMLLDCMLNPIVYVFMNKAMRYEITKMISRRRPKFIMENGRRPSGETSDRSKDKGSSRFSRRSMSEPSATNGMMKGRPEHSALGGRHGSLPDQMSSWTFLESREASERSFRNVTFGGDNNRGLDSSTMTNETLLPGEVPETIT